MEVCIVTTLNGEGFVFSTQNGKTILSLVKNVCATGCSLLHSTKTNNFLICAQKNKPSIFLYDIRKEEPLYYCSQQETITSLCIGSEQKTFLFGGSIKGNIFVWKMNNGKLVKLFRCFTKPISAMKATPCSSYLICGSTNSFINIYKTHDILDVTKSSKSISPVHKINKHSLCINDIFCTKIKNCKFLSCSNDRSVRMFDVSIGKEIFVILYPSSVKSLCLNDMEHTLFVGCDNGKIYEINLYPKSYPSYGNERKEEGVDIEPTAFVNILSGEKGGTKIFSIEHYFKNNIKDYEISKLKGYMSHVYFGHTNSITQLKLAQGNDRLFSSSKDGSIIIWDIQTKQRVLTFKRQIGKTNNEITNVMVTKLSKESLNKIEKIKKNEIGIKPFGKFIQISDVNNVEYKNEEKTKWNRLRCDFYDEKIEGISHEVNEILQMTLSDS